MLSRSLSRQPDASFNIICSPFYVTLWFLLDRLNDSGVVTYNTKHSIRLRIVYQEINVNDVIK